MLLYRIFLQRSYGTQTYISMIPLILGVALTTIADYEATPLGFILTALGVILAAVKSIATNRLMTGSLALSPLELLARMSPLAAAQCLFYAYMSGELSKLGGFVASGECGTSMMVAVTINACAAFALNAVSFSTNKLAGALTMAVCGNVKQCLTIVLGVALFHVSLSPVNIVGMVMAAGGAFWYSKVELASRKKG